jgi:hypothetical protein
LFDEREKLRITFLRVTKKVSKNYFSELINSPNVIGPYPLDHDSDA